MIALLILGCWCLAGGGCRGEVGGARGVRGVGALLDARREVSNATGGRRWRQQVQTTGRGIWNERGQG